MAEALAAFVSLVAHHFFFPCKHLNCSCWLESWDWQVSLSWDCVMPVRTLFTVPAWQSWMILQMFQESCKYLPWALMSVDGPSHRKDISVFLSVSFGRAVKRRFPFMWSGWKRHAGIFKNNNFLKSDPHIFGNNIPALTFSFQLCTPEFCCWQ